MNQYTNTSRLNALHQEATQYAQLEITRQQDRQALKASLNTMLEVFKHWTIGIPTHNTINLRKSL